MINHNGSLQSEEISNVGLNNRAFKYGDGIFDTLKLKDGVLCFLEDHYFRLMSSMRMLRMRIPMDLTLDFYEKQIRTTLEANSLNTNARIRVNVYRKDGGLYTPLSNEIDFLIETSALPSLSNEHREIELFKDFPVGSGLLSTIKTNNRMVNILGSIFAQENNYQNCILLNEKKELVEALNSNIFLIKGEEILTPALTSGCINGIIRKKLIELLKKKGYLVKETSISPFDLLKVEEVFLTNSIHEIQTVNQYRKKTYATAKTREIMRIFETELNK